MAELAENEPPEPAEEPLEPQEEPAEEPLEDDEGAEPAEPAEPAEDAPAPTGGLTDKEIDARFDKLNRENARHADRVGQILEEDAQDLLMCPLCSPFIAGFLLNAPVADEPKMATLGFLGVLDTSELVPADYLVRCETCNGRGEVATHSQRDGYMKENCKRCEGRGYRQLAAATGLNGTMAADYVAPPDDFVPPPPDDDPNIVALKAAGYTVVPPFQPVNSGG